MAVVTARPAPLGLRWRRRSPAAPGEARTKGGPGAAQAARQGGAQYRGRASNAALRIHPRPAPVPPKWGWGGVGKRRKGRRNGALRAAKPHSPKPGWTLVISAMVRAEAECGTRCGGAAVRPPPGGCSAAGMQEPPTGPDRRRPRPAPPRRPAPEPPGGDSAVAALRSRLRAALRVAGRGRRP